MTFRKITIVGLGLMGGSLAAICRRKIPKAQIIGVTRNRAALLRARRKKWIHFGTTNLRCRESMPGVSTDPSVLGLEMAAQQRLPLPP